MSGEHQTDNHNNAGSRSRQDGRIEPGYDKVILLLLFALFLLLSPLIEWWAADHSPWYAPYLIWALLIALSWRLRCSFNRNLDGSQRDD